MFAARTRCTWPGASAWTAPSSSCAAPVLVMALDATGVPPESVGPPAPGAAASADLVFPVIRGRLALVSALVPSVCWTRSPLPVRRLALVIQGAAAGDSFPAHGHTGLYVAVAMSTPV
eukprot:5513042-Pyramimonas_sp.AAC.3